MTARRSWLAPAATLAVVLAVILGAYGLAQIGGGTRTPRKLPALGLAGSGGAAENASAMSADSKRAPGAMPYPGGRTEYKQSGPFPSDLPDHGNAYELPRGAAKLTDVERLARALGLTGVPVHTEEGWKVSDTKHQLVVSDGPGRPWYFGPAPECYSSPEGKPAPPDQPVSSSDAPRDMPAEAPADSPRDTPGCVATSGGGSASSGTVSSREATTEPAYECPPPPPEKCPENARCAAPAPCEAPSPPPEPPAPSEQESRATAGKVIEATGLVNPKVTATKGYGAWDVQADPVVDDLPTIGWTTYVSVELGPKVRYANGWLGAAEAVDNYPLIEAQAAFDKLKDQPQPMIDIACAPETPECGAGETRTVTVTGVRLGLMFGPALDDSGAAYLVPTWLFSTDNSGELPVVALSEEYFATPSPGPETKPGTGEGSGAPGYDPGAGGTDAPPPPSQVDPAPPQETPKPTG